MVKNILFLCGHNAGRSQMAQAFFNNLNKNKSYAGVSAGTNISKEINPVCTQAMSEIGIDMSDKSTYYPKVIKKSKHYYKIYSMGCGALCELKADKDLKVDDPNGKSIKEVRIIRDDVKNKIKKIVEKLND